MQTYRLSIAAKEDLRRIYEYGYHAFGAKHADAYFLGFFQILDEIAAHPLRYPAVNHIRNGYRRCAYKADTIYYRINNKTVEIMATLGGQDIDKWL